MRGLPAVGLPLSVSVLDRIPESRRGRPPLAGRGDNPALSRRPRVVVSPAGDEYKMLPAAAPPPFGGWRHYLARWEACHWILSRLSAPYESSSLATPYSGGTMGAEQWRQFEFMAVAERKPYNRASPEENKPITLAGAGNAPLLPPAAASPPEGEICSPLSF